MTLIIVNVNVTCAHAHVNVTCAHAHVNVTCAHAHVNVICDMCVCAPVAPAAWGPARRGVRHKRENGGHNKKPRV